MSHPILSDAQAKMKKAVDYTLHEFSAIHTGKATPAMVENVMVEAYGSMMRLKELATISAPEARMLMVQPFDQSTMKAVEKAIQSSGLGLNPASQGKFIRIVLPDLSAERRQEFIKICKKMTEDGRVAIRSERRAAMDLLKKAKADGTSEDDVKGAETDVQKLTDGYIAKLDGHLGTKEIEILKV
jgi:ribosome recycling factor